MIPRKSLAIWQEAAQGFPCDLFAFARFAGLRDDDLAFDAATFESRVEQVCYPFPSPWPDPAWVRSFFAASNCVRLGRSIADRANDCIFHFRSAGSAVKLTVIKTPERGLNTCRKNSSSWRFLHFRLLAALHLLRQPVAPVLARALVPLLALSPKTTSRKQHLLVACLAQLLPIKACATNLILSAAKLRQHFSIKSHPSISLGWLFSFQTASCVRARAT